MCPFLFVIKHNKTYILLLVIVNGPLHSILFYSILFYSLTTDMQCADLGDRMFAKDFTICYSGCFDASLVIIEVCFHVVFTSM